MMKTIVILLISIIAIFGRTVSSFSVSPGIATSASQKQHHGHHNVIVHQATVQDDDDYEFARISRRRRRQQERRYEEDEEVYEQSEGVFGDDEDEWDDDEDDEDDDEWDEDGEEYDLFSNVLIDNPLLDRIDPDGAAERFPELAADPRFWLDMVLFTLFLNFLSGIGPQYYDALWFRTDLPPVS